MSGKGAQRGFIFQSLIAMIECFERTDWDAIKMEPQTDNDKVDIQLSKGGQTLTAIQVKSSQYEFSKPEVERWLSELRKDSTGANEIRLCLVGDTYSADCDDYIRRNSREIKKAPFADLEYLCLGKLTEYIKNAGLADQVCVPDLYSIDASLFSKIHRNSIANEALSREAFEEAFRRALPFRPCRSFKKTIDEIRDKEENSNSFNYLYGKLKTIFGRKKELTFLRTFLRESGGSIRFCVVTGPGGIGKSKLVYSLVTSEQAEDWRMVYISGPVLKDILALEKMDYDRNLLLIIDYAANYAEDIHRLLLMAREKWNPRLRLRIILIEREGLYPEGFNYRGEPLSWEERSPEWFRTIIEEKNSDFGVSHDNKDLLYAAERHCFLELGGLEKKNDYAAMIREYARSLALEHELTQAEIDRILQFCYRQFKGENPRPLYVLFTTSALLENAANDESNWDIPRMLNYVYKREWGEWRKKIENEELLGALAKMLVFATVFEKWEAGTAPLDCLKDTCDIIQRHRFGETDRMRTWIKIMTGADCAEADEIYMSALEPDLLGEYFVLEQKRMWGREHSEWEYQILKEIDTSYDFMRHCVEDFPSGSFSLVKGLLIQLNSHKNSLKDPGDDIKRCFKLVRLYLQHEKLKHNREKVLDLLYSFIRGFKEPGEDVAVVISRNVTHYLIGDIDLRNCCEITRDYFVSYPQNDELMSCYTICVDKAVKNSLFVKPSPVDGLLAERNKIIRNIDRETSIIDYLIAETTFIRKLIARYGCDLGYEAVLKNVTERHFQLIEQFYRCKYFDRVTASHERLKKGEPTEKAEDLSWTTLVWSIPSMVIPIITVMCLYDKNQLAFELYAKYYVVWVRDNRRTNYTAEWRYKSYMTKYNLPGEFYIALNEE